MKRVLLAALLAGVSVAPGQAMAGDNRVHVTTRTENGVGVGTAVTINGHYQPLVGVRYDATKGEVCAGFSYQVPQCVETTIQVGG